MTYRYLYLAGAAGLLAGLAAAPAAAQKSKDTLRIAINDMFRVSDPYHFPLDGGRALRPPPWPSFGSPGAG